MSFLNYTNHSLEVISMGSEASEISEELRDTDPLHHLRADSLEV